MKNHLFFYGFCLCLLTARICVAMEPMAPASMPALVDSLRFAKPLDFCGEPVPLDIPDVRERLEKEMLLTLYDRPQIILWIKRANRYFPIIETMLSESGLPSDLKYIAIIESALRPHVGSPKGAIGFWQFMQGTGELYGLTINGYLDERRNIFKSTRAAIDYFKQLHADFGSWSLAAAAYNMGEEGLRTEMLLQNADEYYRLYLPLETQRYLFRAVCAKLILTDPLAYGFDLMPQELYPPLSFDRITVQAPENLPIHLIAASAETYFKRIKDLNPELRGHFLSEGEHTLLIPPGKAEGFHDRFERLLSSWQAETGQIVYEVQPGDNLSVIADRFNVPLPALLIWNQRSAAKHIHPGDKLVIYAPRVDSAIEQKGEQKEE